MILFEKEKIYGWEAAIRGMRNPKNSWDRSDTDFNPDGSLMHGLGSNDYELMLRLADAGQCHGKYLRMITVTADITAPLYWWQEFDTYKVGTVRNSCSKMHKLLSKEFVMDDFSHEKVAWSNTGMHIFTDLIAYLNRLRDAYLEEPDPKIKKLIWYQLLQLLPASYNQKSTVLLNYAVLKNIFEYRHDHKLNEWRDFCAWITRMPYSRLITGKQVDHE